MKMTHMFEYSSVETFRACVQCTANFLAINNQKKELRRISALVLSNMETQY
jgi:hypothetical protein